jgi:hypothetical protein
MNPDTIWRYRSAIALAVLLVFVGCLGLAGCSTVGGKSAAPEATGTSAPHVVAKTAASIAASDGERLDSDFEHASVDVDQFLIRDPARIASASHVVSGTIVASGDYALYELIYYWVDTGEAAPTFLLLNGHTRLSWPAAWGRYTPDPQSDPPAVKLPEAMPDDVGLRVVAQARTVVLPGTKRAIAFASGVKYLAH